MIHEACLPLTVSEANGFHMRRCICLCIAFHCYLRQEMLRSVVFVGWFVVSLVGWLVGSSFDNVFFGPNILKTVGDRGWVPKDHQ